MFKVLLCIVCVAVLPGCKPDRDSELRSELAAAGELFFEPPTIRPNPIERAPLIAIIDVSASTKVTPILLIDDGDRQWEQRWSNVASLKHRIAALGLRPDREHKIQVKLTTADGKTSQLSKPISFKTPPLPANFPPLKVVRAESEKMEPGLTMFAVNIWSNSVSVLDYGFIVMLDIHGEVVWYCETGDRIADMRILHNGNILYQHGSYRYAYEIDVFGRDLNRWVTTNLTELPDDKAIGIEIDTTHHDLLELPNGNFLTLATELHHVDAYPTSEFERSAPREPATLVCDAIVEFDRTTGKIVDRFHLRDILDPNRIGYISLGSFWKDKYDEYLHGDRTRDWSHANALVYLEDEDALLVSFRHLDCIYKLDYKTKQIKWILGNPDAWAPEFEKYLLKPEGNFDWFYHQHSPQMTPRGTLMFYDNGNYRARPYQKATLAPNNRSRVLELKINESTRTFQQVFEYDGGDDHRFYCPFYCEADWMPNTNNLLITDGGHIELEDGTPHDEVPAERQWARIFEITRSPPERVFEVTVDSGIGSKFGWSIYRANKIPSFLESFRLVPPSADENHQLMLRDRHRKKAPNW